MSCGGAGCATKSESAWFLGYSYRSLKEVVTRLELCERLFLTLSVPVLTASRRAV